MDKQRCMTGTCFCGSVSYTVTGCPTLSAFCHCTQCQRLSGCPLVHTIHFPDSAFSWTNPLPHEEKLDSYVNPTKPWKTRWRCRSCGACVSSFNSKTNQCSVWGAHLARDATDKILDWELVKPTAHIFYETRMLNVIDDLSKWTGYENRSTRLE